ncbi:MAG TPA: HD-GYP domain-containing protein [Permianibacter sp.]|nr:HD-GYP domain-containing protein [Permianibacter sp.]
MANHEMHSPSITAVEDLQQTLAQYRQALLASLLVSAWMVEARDPYTGGHLWRVARMSHALSLAVGDSPAEANRISIAGFLHDIGKIGIPDAVLRKPGKLTDEEFAIIKTHPRVGNNMLTGHPLAALVEHAVHFHHEMPNGKGYPNGLHGESIPRDGRLVGICDAFDAMTSTRPYRAGMPIEKALSIIESHLGEQFDRALGTAFLQLGRSGALDHIVGHTDEGIPLGMCPSCGPILVQHRDTHAGDHTACPACESEFVWQAQGKGLAPVATGRKAVVMAHDQAPDQSIIHALVQRWAVHNAA